MHTALFLFGTLWFWLLSVLAVIIIACSLEHRKWGGTGATITLVSFFLLVYALGGNTIQTFTNYITSNPLTSLAYIASYIVIGVLWSFVKWYYFLLNYKEKNKTTDPKWKNYIPKVASNKGKIISWMTYWPISASWTIINDPIRRMYNSIFKRLDKVYVKISDKVFKD